MEIYSKYSKYFELIKNTKSRPYQLLRGTKLLALSEEKYNSFYKSTSYLFNNSFKLNKENNKNKETPKYERKKFNYLTNKFNKGPLSANRNKSKLMTEKMNKKNIIFEKYKKKKKIYFFVGEDKFKHINGFNLYKIKNNKKLNININDDIFKENLSIKNSEKKVKDFFMLLDSIFFEKNYYKNLYYWEKEIYNHKEDYYDYLKDIIIYYINKEKDFNMNSEFHKIFQVKKYGKIDLYLKSIRIEIYDIKNNNKNILTISLPFNLMCILYLCDGKEINKIILFLLNNLGIKKFLNNSSEEININNNELKKKVILDLLNKIKLEKGKIKLNIKQKNFERYYSKIRYLEKIKEISEQIKYRITLNEFFKNQNTIKIINKSNYNNNINKKINFDTNIYKYQYNLIMENNIYKINFIFPEIILEYNSSKKQIMNRYINKELFLYLHQNNFMNWDFYVLHFLYSFKHIRRVMSGFFSTRNNKNKIITPNLNINNIYNNNISNYDFNLNNMTEFSLKNYEYIFLFLDNVNLYLFKLRSFTLYAFFTDIKKPFIYEFKFNFIHMKILYIINLFEKLGNFLYRLIYIKNNEIIFDYSYFDLFTKMSNREIFNYFNDIYILKNNNNDNITPEKENDCINNISLRILEPFIEVININQFQKKYKILQSNIKLKNHFIKELIKNDINNWIQIINKYKNDLNHKFHVKYEEMRNKQVRRKISIFNNTNKNQNIDKLFNIFLKNA